MASDNRNMFVSNLWKSLQAALGVQVLFTPLYHTFSLGSIERQNKYIKLGFKTTLHAVEDEHGSSWMSALPCVMLGRRTAFQPMLDATSVEIIFLVKTILIITIL